MRLPWTDSAGRFAPLKAATFVALFVPAIVLANDYAQHALGPRPITAAIQTTGLWAIRLLLLSLAITPLRQVLRWPALANLRRMIGVAAFAYGALHLSFFAADKRFELNVVANEILLRHNLAIGAWALFLLLLLAATSTDAMMRRMGGKEWQTLHRVAYVAALLVCIHFFMQSKLNAWEPTVMAGLLAWLLAYRLLVSKLRSVSVVMLAALSVGVCVLTGLGEAAYYGLFTGADPWRVLAANVSQFGERPAGTVLLAGLGLMLVAGSLSAWRGRAKVTGPVTEVS
jgi:methionine sulfoxide reductase heme-binding subunit